MKATTKTIALRGQEHEQVAGSVGRNGHCSFRKAMPLLGVLGLAVNVVCGTPCTFPVGAVEYRENLPIVAGRIEFATILSDEAVSELTRQTNG